MIQALYSTIFSDGCAKAINSPINWWYDAASLFSNPQRMLFYTFLVIFFTMTWLVLFKITASLLYHQDKMIVKSSEEWCPKSNW